jgi:nucleoid-associated protein YgaU
MGIFDKKDDPSFGDKPDGGVLGKKATSPDFSDTTGAGSTAGRTGTGKADFSDVTSGSGSTAPAASTGGQSYTVKSGDSLSKIAKHFYGDANKWQRIYEANRDKIKNPDLIHPGQEFTIPEA